MHSRSMSQPSPWRGVPSLITVASAVIFLSSLPGASAVLSRSETRAALQHVRETIRESSMPKKYALPLNAMLRSAARTTKGVDNFTNTTLLNVSDLLSQVMYDLYTERVERDQALGDRVQAGWSCNIVDIFQDSYWYTETVTEAVSHMECRVVEEGLYSETTTTCSMIEVFQTSIRADGVQDFCNIPVADPNNVQAFADVLTAGSAYYNRTREEYVELVENCTNVTNWYMRTREECNEIQYSYETKFCLWTAHRLMMCSNREPCYNQAQVQYESTVQTVQAQSEDSAKLAQIVTYVMCVVDGIVYTDTFNQTNCPLLSLDPLDPVLANFTSNITEYPELLPCNETEVACHPGTANWTYVAYQALLNSFAYPAPTHGCGNNISYLYSWANLTDINMSGFTADQNYSVTMTFSGE